MVLNTGDERDRCPRLCEGDAHVTGKTQETFGLLSRRYFLSLVYAVT